MRVNVLPVSDKHLRNGVRMQDREESITETLENLIFVMSRTCILYTEGRH